MTGNGRADKPGRMTPAEYQLVCAIVHEAEDHPERDVEKIAAERCPDRPDLQQKAAAMYRLGQDDEESTDQIVPGIRVQFRDVDRTGQIVDIYKLEKRIGQSHLCEVYTSHNPRTGTAVAVKLLRDFCVENNRYAEEFRGLMEREKRVLERLDAVAEVVKLLDVGTTSDGVPYLVTGYLPGKDIATFCREKNLGLQQVVGLFIKVCRVVATAHRRHIIHRDLKPSNIMVVEQDEPSPRLLDFGISEIFEDTTLGQFHQMFQTRDYAAPEQIHDKLSSPQSDIYSLGKLLAELLDKLPEEKELPRIVGKRTELMEVSRRCTRENPDDRYQEVSHLIQALENIRDDKPIREIQRLDYRLDLYLRRHPWVLLAPILMFVVAFYAYRLGWLEPQRKECAYHLAQQALDIENSLGNIYAMPGDVLAGLGENLETMISDLETRVATFERDCVVNDNICPAEGKYYLGRVYYSLGRFEEARALLLEAKALGANDGVDQYLGLTSAALFDQVRWAAQGEANPLVQKAKIQESNQYLAEIKDLVSMNQTQSLEITYLAALSSFYQERHAGFTGEEEAYEHPLALTKECIAMQGWDYRFHHLLGLIYTWRALGFYKQGNIRAQAEYELAREALETAASLSRSHPRVQEAMAELEDLLYRAFESSEEKNRHLDLGIQAAVKVTLLAPRNSHGYRLLSSLEMKKAFLSPKTHASLDYMERAHKSALKAVENARPTGENSANRSYVKALVNLTSIRVDLVDKRRKYGKDYQDLLNYATKTAEELGHLRQDASIAYTRGRVYDLMASTIEDPHLNRPFYEAAAESFRYAWNAAPDNHYFLDLIFTYLGRIGSLRNYGLDCLAEIETAAEVLAQAPASYHTRLYTGYIELFRAEHLESLGQDPMQALGAAEAAIHQALSLRNSSSPYRILARIETVRAFFKDRNGKDSTSHFVKAREHLEQSLAKKEYYPLARIAQGDLNTWFALHQLARGQDGLVALKQGRHLLEEVLEKNGDERAQPILIRNHLVEAFAGPDVAQAALTRARDLLDPAIAKAPRSYQYMNMDLETSRLELRLTLENGGNPETRQIQVWSRFERLVRDRPINARLLLLEASCSLDEALWRGPDSGRQSAVERGLGALARLDETTRTQDECHVLETQLRELSIKQNLRPNTKDRTRLNQILANNPYLAFVNARRAGMGG